MARLIPPNMLQSRETGVGGAMKESWMDITAEITLNGSYSVSEGSKTLTVKSPYGSKTTQLGGLRPEVLARIMLRELVQDKKR